MLLFLRPFLGLTVVSTIPKGYNTNQSLRRIQRRKNALGRFCGPQLMSRATCSHLFPRTASADAGVRKKGGVEVFGRSFQYGESSPTI